MTQPWDQDLKTLLDKLAHAPRIDWKAGVEDVRAQFWKAAQSIESDAPALHEIRDLKIQGGAGPLNARLYTPFAAGVGEGAGLVYFHGGGFVVGGLDSHEMLCRRLAAAARIRILSVAYRLSPEHRFPCAVEDALAATHWAFAHHGEIAFDPARIAIGGDSAGGALAAVTAQTMKRHASPEERLKAQLLLYPLTQMVRMTPSQMRMRQTHVLTQAALDFVKERYLSNPDDAFDVRCSPLLENDLAHLPPAYIVTAGFDPLYDEGKAYADKLAACGVPVTHRHYPSQVHGFFSMTAISAAARQAIIDAAAWLSDHV
ncbi:MAG: alpha/beta hydrolase [Hyphomonadaceae bacterium]